MLRQFGELIDPVDEVPEMKPVVIENAELMRQLVMPLRIAHDRRAFLGQLTCPEAEEQPVESRDVCEGVLEIRAG